MSAEKLIGMLSRIVGPRQMATDDLMEEWSAADLELDSFNSAVCEAWASLRQLITIADGDDFDRSMVDSWTVHTVKAVMELSDELRKRVVD